MPKDPLDNIWQSNEDFISQKEIDEFDDYDNFDDFFPEAISFGEEEY